MTPPQENIPYGYCHCGCGQKTKISPNTDRTAGWSRGVPRRFLSGHCNKTHGYSKTLTYKCWINILQRCENPSDSNYPQYGARGITVCERWREFANFLADMGPKPKGLTIDRIKNERGYEPDNCRWATYTEQNRNRTINRHVLWDGRIVTFSELLQLTQINRSTFQNRMRRGMNALEAATTPVDKSHSHAKKR